MNIDMHTHFLPPAYLDLIRKEGNPYGRHLSTSSDGTTTIHADKRLIPLDPGFHDVNVKLANMAAQGMDQHVISPPPFIFHYDLEGPQGSELARLCNDEAHKLSVEHSDKFIPMATLPMQDIDLAIEEMVRVVDKLGFRSVEIGASINEKELDHPDLFPFWESAERLGVLVFIHPHRPPGRERMNDYHLFNMIGFLTETTLVASRLIFSGVIDRFPRLKICLAHAGGMLLWIQGRFDHGFHALDVCKENIDTLPSEYLKSFYYDSVTHSPNALRFVMDSVGHNQILLGSDYPFLIGENHPLRSIDQVPGLLPEERDAICGGNAERLFLAS